MDPFLFIWCSFAVSVVGSKSIRKLRNETWEYCENQIRLNKKFPFSLSSFFHTFTRKKASFKRKILSLERCCPRFKRFYNFLLLYVTSCASSLMRFSAHFILSTCFNWTCFTTSRFYFQYVDISKMIKYFLYLEFQEISNELRTLNSRRDFYSTVSDAVKISKNMKPPSKNACSIVVVLLSIEAEYFLSANAYTSLLTL